MPVFHTPDFNPSRPGEDRQILHRQDLAFDHPAGQWQELTVDLTAMTPTFHGDPVDAAPLVPARAVELGFILNDTQSGPFTLRVDRIDILR